MVIPVCPGCTRTIIPKADDSCPNCGFKGVENVPLQTPQATSAPSPVTSESQKSDLPTASCLPMEPEYGGFWIRLVAFLLDFLIYLPIPLVMNWIEGLDRTLFPVGILAGLGFFIVFHVGCVVRWGATPGKLMCGLRIVTTSLTPVGGKEAWLRQSVWLAIVAFGSFISLQAWTGISDVEYFTLNFWQRSHRLAQLGGTWTTACIWLQNLWAWSEFLVLLTNRKKRALHDFIAGTLVIRMTGRPDSGLK